MTFWCLFAIFMTGLVMLLYSTNKLGDELTKTLRDKERVMSLWGSCILFDIPIVSMSVLLGWTGMIVGFLWLGTTLSDVFIETISEKLRKQNKTKEQCFIHPDIKLNA